MSSAPVTITGNLTADPEVRFFDSGAQKLSFSVAVNNFWTDAKGEKQEKTSFFNVVAWRNLADDAVKTLEKGLRVVVTGRLEQESWDDKETGKKRSTVNILADEIGISVRGIESIRRKPKTEASADGYPSASRGGAKTATRTATRPATTRQEADQYEEGVAPF